MARATTSTAKKNTPKKATAPTKRTYLKQSDVPSASLADALRIPSAIAENYGGKPTPPLQVAKALNVDPGGSQIKVLSGASIAFGLIEGGAQAQTIALTLLAQSILRPKTEEEDAAARREAVLRPRVFKEFLNHYDKHPFPRADLAVNVLEEMGVPRDKAPEVLERLETSARAVGFLHQIKEKTWVFLGATETTAAPPEEIEPSEADIIRPDLPRPTAPDNLSPPAVTPPPPQVPLPVDLSQNTTLAAAVADDARRRKVFITHGKDRALVDPIKRLLEYGELEPVVSVERSSVSKPVEGSFQQNHSLTGTEDYRRFFSGERFARAFPSALLLCDLDR
jgi:hypothetical protein